MSGPAMPDSVASPNRVRVVDLITLTLGVALGLAAYRPITPVRSVAGAGLRHSLIRDYQARALVQNLGMSSGFGLFLAG